LNPNRNRLSQKGRAPLPLAEAPRKVVSHFKSGGILLGDGAQRESAAQVEAKPGATVDATVGFVAVPA